MMGLAMAYCVLLDKIFAHNLTVSMKIRIIFVNQGGT